MLYRDSFKTRPLRYVGFPSFAAWEKNAPSLERWEQSMAQLRGFKPSSDILHRARLIMTAAAFRDLQQTPAEGDDEISLFGELCRAAGLVTNTGISLRARLLACAHTMSFAVSNQRISEPWIRKLQWLICNIRGEGAGYKRSPNRMLRQNGRARFGAPVSRTAQEMTRYIHELRSKKFLGSHPVLQASYSHYSLVLIHPFSDGNGRVARSLAGAFLYRATSIPVLSLDQDRGKYLSSLRAADTGNFREFVDLVQDSSIVSSTQIRSSILAAMELGSRPQSRSTRSMADKPVKVGGSTRLYGGAQ